MKDFLNLPKKIFILRTGDHSVNANQTFGSNHVARGHGNTWGLRLTITAGHGYRVSLDFEAHESV